VFACTFTMMMHGVANECWFVARGVQARGWVASSLIPARARRLLQVPRCCCAG
jgi:hypothetical protein